MILAPVLSILAQSMRVGGTEPTERFFLNLSNFTGGGSITKAQGVCTIEQVGVLNPVINVNRSSGVAPLSVVFDAINTQALPSLAGDTFHEVRYGWDFGDNKGVFWEYGTKPGVANKNVAYGPVAAHVFETPGTHTVTCWAWAIDVATGQLYTKSTTHTVTVDDPDVVFAGANTICVANGTLPVAGVDGVPAGATCVNEPVWANVVALMGSGKRVLCKHDDVWASTTQGVVPTGTTSIIGMYGVGAKPKITSSSNVRGVYLAAGRNDYRVMDLRFEYIETGGSLADNQYKIPIDTVSAQYATILRCEGLGFYSSVQAQLSDDIMVVDCDFEQTFLNYGNMNSFYYLSHRVALLGNRFERSYSTHTVRISGTSRCVVSNNYMANPGPTRHVFTIRGWEATSPITQYSVVSDNVMHGGTVGGYALYCGPVNLATNELVEDLIYERNYLTSQSPAYTVVLAVHQGMTFRSNIVLSRHECGLCVVGEASAASAPPIDTSVYGNTFYKDSIATTAYYSTFVISGTTVSGVKFGNNLSYAPNCTHDAGGGGSQASMVYLSLGAVSGNYSFIGTDTDDTQLNTVRPWAATTPVVYADYTPTGYALNSGTALPTSSDFFNNLITDPRNIGAIQ